jgi:hemerythrin-like domain-containing protein
MHSGNTRRTFLCASATVGTGFFFSACSGSNNSQSGKQTSESGTKKEEEEGEVTAIEDLMREHGIIRRALLVYTAAANKLRTNAASVPAETLQKTAKLFRTFGEDYHEKKLEETYIFPAIKRAGGPAATYPDILVAQHNRGREITDYILSVTQGAKRR